MRGSRQCAGMPEYELKMSILGLVECGPMWVVARRAGGTFFVSQGLCLPRCTQLHGTSMPTCLPVIRIFSVSRVA